VNGATFLAVPPSWAPLPTNRRYVKGIARIDRVVDEMIQERREAG
jgi:cytochrome P450